MKQNHLIISICIAISYAVVVLGQSSAAARRCFQFTWLGPSPRYNNESVFLNATCQDATRLSGGVPCSEPLVASYDGSWPDVEHIWRYHSLEASCILADNDVCAQYTYYFNGQVENSTYMCTRAIDNMDQAITSGCYEQRNGSFATRVCLCRSVPGSVPCNGASLVSLSLFAGIFVIIALFCRDNLKR